MSSRSNGVTKVLFTRRTMAWVVSSQACSASRMRCAMAARSVPSAIISASRLAPTTRCWADSAKRS